MYCMFMCVRTCLFIQSFVGLHVRPKLDPQLLTALDHPLGIPLHFVHIHHQSRGTQGRDGLPLHNASAGACTGTHTHMHKHTPDRPIKFLGMTALMSHTSSTVTSIVYHHCHQHTYLYFYQFM